MSEENKKSVAEKDDIIVCENLVKIYKTLDTEVVALQGLDLTVERNSVMAIIGNSGSGKSTLLNILGGLDKPSAGQLTIDGQDFLKYNDNDMIKYKRDFVGFVWQNNARNLVPYLSALENVEQPMIFRGKRDRKYALELLDMMGLHKRRKSRLNQMSGGEQQRVAIAIALANKPKILLADEPTGAVDNKTSDLIMNLMKEFSTSLGITVVIVTHDRNISKKVDRVVTIRDGRTSSEILRRTYSKDLSEIASLSDANHADQPHAEEFAVIDRVGRVQIPKEYLKQLGLSGHAKVKIDMDDDVISIKLPEALHQTKKPDNDTE